MIESLLGDMFGFARATKCFNSRSQVDPAENPLCFEKYCHSRSKTTEISHDSYNMANSRMPSQKQELAYMFIKFNMVLSRKITFYFFLIEVHAWLWLSSFL